MRRGRAKPSRFEADDDSEDEDSQFNAWSAFYSKGFKTTEEHSERKKNWKKVNRMIREKNADAMASGNLDPVFMGHNEWSGSTKKEIREKLGRVRSRADKKSDSSTRLG